MYLSKIRLKTEDSYDQHQDIWSLFPNVPERKRDHLFRVETGDRDQKMVLLQSATQPQSSSSAEVIQSKQFTPKLSLDAYYKFKVLAYPTKCLSKNKKVVELKDEGQQVEWLQRKLAGANVMVTSMASQLVSNKKTRHSRFVCFEGVLQVRDVEQMERVLVSGIGRKKHAGAGLLTLARTH